MSLALRLSLFALLSGASVTASAESPPSKPEDAKSAGQEEKTPPADSSSPQDPSVPQEDPAAPADVWNEDYDKLDHVLALDQLHRRSDDVQRKIAALLDRVALLRETVIVGSIAPSRTLVVHKNDLGDSFQIEHIEYVLDGESLLSKNAKDSVVGLPPEFEVVNGALPPGDHMLEVRMVCNGSGDGLFSYFKGYRFKVESKYQLKVAEGRLTHLEVMPHMKADITLDAKDRLAIKYNHKIEVIAPKE